jgi:hypothetical protein
MFDSQYMLKCEIQVKLCVLNYVLRSGHVLYDGWRYVSAMTAKRPTQRVFF